LPGEYGRLASCFRSLRCDPVRLGVVASLARPTGNLTGVNLFSGARAISLEVQIFNATTSREISEVFATFGRERPDALVIDLDPFLTSRRVQLVTLAMRHAIPASYAVREFAEIGGLMSYGSRLIDAYRQLGVYTGRVLKGAKPAELPVLQASKFELVINAETARILGVSVPASLLATADDVIE
jgi:putative ABC transport system substrate-binding protein